MRWRRRMLRRWRKRPPRRVYTPQELNAFYAKLYGERLNAVIPTWHDIIVRTLAHPMQGKI